MVKNILLVIILVTNLSCKKNDIDKNDKKSVSELKSIQNIDTIKQEINQKTEPIIVDCSKVLVDLIKKSNVKNAFKDELKVKIESQNSINMKLRLFVEDGNNTVGWINFDAENKRLLDFTNDIENPERLNFDKVVWNEIIDCFFNKNKSYYIDDEKESSGHKNCETSIIEMGVIKECTIVNSTIEKVYFNMIKNAEIDKPEYLLKSIPKKNQIIKIKKDGLINIEYKINSNKLDIEFNYEGGVNSIKLEQIKENVKSTIIHSAD